MKGERERGRRGTRKKVSRDSRDIRLEGAPEANQLPDDTAGHWPRQGQWCNDMAAYGRGGDGIRSRATDRQAQGITAQGGQTRHEGRQVGRGKDGKRIFC